MSRASRTKALWERARAAASGWGARPPAAVYVLWIVIAAAGLTNAHTLLGGPLLGGSVVWRDDGSVRHAGHGDHELRAGRAMGRHGHSVWAAWIVNVREGRVEAREVLNVCGWNGNSYVGWDGGGRAWFYCSDTQSHFYWEREPGGRWSFHRWGRRAPEGTRGLRPPDSLRRR